MRNSLKLPKKCGYKATYWEREEGRVSAVHRKYNYEEKRERNIHIRNLWHLSPNTTLAQN